MSKSSGSAERRAWRRAKSKAVCDALRGLAALEGLDLGYALQHNDAGQARQQMLWRVDALVVQTTCTRAAVEFCKQYPKPKLGQFKEKS